jgi:hypothetical protein
MSKVVYAVLVLTVLLAPSLSFSQDYSRYTPYGLRFPLLDKGEYNLSVSGSYYESEYKSEDISTGSFSRSNYFDNYMYLSAAYALSRQFIISGSFSYYPSRTTSNYMSVTMPGSTYYTSHGERDGYFAPYLTLAYKPTNMMEVFATFNTSSSDSKSIYPTYTYEATSKSKGFSLGLNYIGQF